MNNISQIIHINYNSVTIMHAIALTISVTYIILKYTVCHCVGKYYIIMFIVPIYSRIRSHILPPRLLGRNNSQQYLVNSRFILYL